MNTWTVIDISRPLNDRLTIWPGNADAPIEIERKLSIAQGNECNLTALHMGSHIGTHVDAPKHFVDSGATIDQLPVTTWVRECTLVDIDAPDVGAEQVEAMPLPPGCDSVLIRTDNSRRREMWDAYGTDRCYLTEGGAKALLARGIRFIGVDVLSVDKPGTPGFPAHHALLGAGVAVVEGLYLRDAQPGAWTIVCPPVRVDCVEGAPCRALLIRFP